MLTTIFSGIEILFFFLGVLTTLAIMGMISLNKKYDFDWKAWTISILGTFLVIFAVAWSVSSVLEGEPRAASMGLVVFGLLGLILLALARRLIISK